MGAQNVELIHDSLSRCLENERFFDLFYEMFLQSSEEVKQKFAGTDLERQKRMLRKSLTLVLLAVQGEQSVSAELEGIARRHSKQDRDIPPYLYELWLECLLEAVRQCDTKYNSEIEEAWRVAMAFGIQFMIDRYDPPA